ncbi:hypothetical protein [Nevskia ramosa]|uniref:hypothetical protein n=1 Tax=Nevskia ramosa TaxID=64002 RepID=UPI0003B6133E|nr:hypothetical protein [Nevskia ramosa]
MNPLAVITATPRRAQVAESVGINLAASAAFYLVTTDRMHWKAATAAGLIGVWLWRNVAAARA